MNRDISRSSCMVFPLIFPSIPVTLPPELIQPKYLSLNRTLSHSSPRLHQFHSDNYSYHSISDSRKSQIKSIKSLRNALRNSYM